MRAVVIWLALIASVPPVLLAVHATVVVIHQFSDPCFEWGAGSLQSRTLSADDPCAATGSGGTSETRAQALARLLLIPGGMLVGIALGIFGAARRRPLFAVLGAVLMYLESLPFMLTFASIAALTSGAFLPAARAAGPVRGAPKVIMRVLGVVAAAMALNWIRQAIQLAGQGEVLLLLLVVIGLNAFVAVAAWWPSSRPASA